MRDAVLLGIDFSGDVTQWRASEKRPTVWIAAARPLGAGLEVTALAPVQALPGVEPPFARLQALLADGTGFAAIDAPLAIPAGYGPPPEELWRALDAAERGKRDFAQGRALLDIAFGTDVPRSKAGKPDGRKLYRATEQTWRDRRVETRSTLWNGARGGAPFSVAAMTLLARHSGPIWPFRIGDLGRTLVEGFPAAQLCQWGLASPGYAKGDAAGRDKRLRIVARLMAAHGLTFADGLEALCLDHVDALDAVLCCYCALAVATGRLADPPGPAAAQEGHIAVHI
jgi:hypothetical protein